MAEANANDLELHVDVGNEQVVLAAMALDIATCDRVLSVTRDDAFLVDENRAAVSVLREMRQRGIAYESTAFARFARGRVRPDYLEQLAQLQGTPTANLEHHLDWLRWDRQKATVAGGSLSDLLGALQNPREAPERVRALARMVGEGFAGDSGAAAYLDDPRALVRAQVEKIRRSLEGEASYPIGIPGVDFYEENARHPITSDDMGGVPRLIPGVAPGKFTVITAASGGGKSTFAQRVALGLTRRHKRRGVYCAWEPESGDVVEQIAAMSLGWKRTNLMLRKDQRSLRHPMPHEQFVELEEQMHRVSKVVRTIRNPFASGSLPGKASNERNFEFVREHLAASGAEWAIFDLLERCFESNEPSEERKMLFKFQALAVELNMSFIALAQQRLAELEQRADKRPTRDCIMGSKAWIEVADTVIGVHRPGQWKSIGDNTLEILVLKQRFGPWPLAVECEWDGDLGAIEGGRSIEYTRPGEDQGGLLGGFVAPEMTRGQGRGAGGTGKRRGRGG